MTTEVATVRTARKSYTCARQAYWNRLSPEAREYQGAMPCRLGGVILTGVLYAETEGDDAFHPTRQHVECMAWTRSEGAV